MAGQSIERLQFASSAGSSNLNLTGNELANTITGNDGSNVLDGGPVPICCTAVAGPTRSCSAQR